jgi:hypothetical protein|tara:strand:+ start:176 stop:442 length:267 start_codon:yes stop_codon:yes gene_type:complete
MAGKKSSGKNYTSKGERPNVTRSVLNALRREYIQSDMRRNNQAIAWRKGKNVVLTVPNPDKKNTKERMIRVPAIDVWGFPRQANLKMR